MIRSIIPVFFLSLLMITPGRAMDNPAYAVFESDGSSSYFSEMKRAAFRADVTFFGELHNDPIAHWLQIQLAKALHQEFGNLVLGLEMFETDDQLVLSEYLRGQVSSSNFEREAKLWPNYKTDIAPLIELAKEKRFPVVATNIPRRYANLVYHAGPDTLQTLGPAAQNYMMPLPLEVNHELESYKNIAEMAHGHGESYLVEAQAVKDATMAFNIGRNLSTGTPFLHINGAYHSNHHEGIVWYLNEEQAGLEILVISLVLQEDISSLEEGNHGLGDFIIAVPSDMTRTH